MFYTYLQAPYFPCDKLSASRYFVGDALRAPRTPRDPRAPTYRKASNRPQILCPQLARVLLAHIFATIVQFSMKHAWELRAFRR